MLIIFEFHNLFIGECTFDLELIVHYLMVSNILLYNSFIILKPPPFDPIT